MPKRLRVDYDLLKVGYLKGLTFSDLAREHKVNEATLRSYAVRHKWGESKAKTESSLQLSALVAGQQHLTNIGAMVDKKLADLAQFDFATAAKKLDAEGFVRSVETLDRIARRTYRLDADAGPKTQLNLQVNYPAASPGSAPWTIQDAKPVIELTETGESSGETPPK